MFLFYASCIYNVKVSVPSHNNVWLLYNEMTEINWKQQINEVIILITLHVSVSFDHHQVYMKKNVKFTTFMPKYMMKIGQFSTSYY
jgi:hypothetical protein